MSGTKSCPTCQKEWADTFKFCPEDGALLVVVPEPAPPPPPEPVSDRGAEEPSRSSTKSTVKAAKKRDAQKRLINLEPIADPASRTRQQLPAAAPPEPSRRGPRKPSDFSETAWFMRPDGKVDPETGRVRVDPDAYKRDDSIPEEKRRRFSLRRKDEE